METTIAVKDILTALRLVKEAANGNRSDYKLVTSVGICRNLTNALNCECYGFVNKYSIGWPEHSGNIEYPIKHIKDTAGLLHLWNGEEGRQRLSLLDYLIARMESQENKFITWYED